MRVCWTWWILANMHILNYNNNIIQLYFKFIILQDPILRSLNFGISITVVEPTCISYVRYIQAHLHNFQWKIAIAEWYKLTPCGSELIICETINSVPVARKYDSVTKQHVTDSQQTDGQPQTHIPAPSTFFDGGKIKLKGTHLHAKELFLNTSLCSGTPW